MIGRPRHSVSSCRWRHPLSVGSPALLGVRVQGRSEARGSGCSAPLVSGPGWRPSRGLVLHVPVQPISTFCQLSGPCPPLASPPAPFPGHAALSAWVAGLPSSLVIWFPSLPLPLCSSHGSRGILSTRRTTLLLSYLNCSSGFLSPCLRSVPLDTEPDTGPLVRVSPAPGSGEATQSTPQSGPTSC